MFAASLFTLWLACLALVTGASPLSRRDVIAPKITSPTKDSIWVVGTVQTVTWDTSNFPPDNQITNPIGRVLLGFDENDSLNLDINNPLAQGFKLRDGSVQVTVPNVPPKDNYLIVLMGDSGNTSPTFTITRITNNGTSSSSPPTGPSTSSSTSTSIQAPPATSSPSSSPNPPVVVPASPVGGTGPTSVPTNNLNGSTPQATPTSPASTVDQTHTSSPPGATTTSATGAARSIHFTGFFGAPALCAGAAFFTLLLLM